MTEDGIVGHDSPLDKKCRVYASISFAVLLLAIGLPLWWHTTEVPRVNLPYQGIEGLRNLEASMHINIYMGCLEIDKCKVLADELLTRITEEGRVDIITVSISNFRTNGTTFSHARNLAELDEAAGRFKLKVGELLVLETPFVLGGGDLVYVNAGRAVMFDPAADAEKIAQVLNKWLFRASSLSQTRNSLADPTRHSLDVENRRRFPASPDYDVLLTVINPDPDRLRVDRGFTERAMAHLEPFLRELEPLARFTVKSQWLYLLELGAKLPGRPHYALDEDRLPQIITPLESKLASQVSQHPTINLVAYMVPCSTAPLYIYARNGSRANKDRDFEAFLSPRWGGIALVNPPDEYCKRTAYLSQDGSRRKSKQQQQQNNQQKQKQKQKTSSERSTGESEEEAVAPLSPSKESTLEVFLSQLRLLVGIPEKAQIARARMAPPPRGGLKPRGWELDDLMRGRAVEQLTSAKLTLGSLARLLREISNIVITEQVGERIERALRLAQSATGKLEQGDLRGGFEDSKEAFRMSEAAFTDPSLLALLYFPDDQKYAVYIPLFLPVMIPVLFSLKNIKNYFFSRN